MYNKYVTLSSDYELAYQKCIEGFYSGDISYKHKLFNEVKKLIGSHVDDCLQSQFNNQYFSNKGHITVSIHQLQHQELNQYFDFYGNKLFYIIQDGLKNKMNIQALKTLNQYPHHPNNTITTPKGKISICDILNVIGYALDVGELAGLNVENYSRGVTGLKVIHRLLNNDKSQTQSIRDFGLAVEIIAQVGNTVTTNVVTKNGIIIASDMINLTKDFLTNGGQQ